MEGWNCKSDLYYSELKDYDSNFTKNIDNKKKQYNKKVPDREEEWEKGVVYSYKYSIL